MRDILFRGKAIDNNWYYGVPLVFSDNFVCITAPHTYNKSVILETVGQYTGLTDKNGNKIFEGDYWLDTDDDYLVYVVEFRDGQFGFACYGWKGVLMPYGFDENAGGWGEIDFEPMTDFNIELIEIEGNIHDNHEVLRTPTK